MDGEGAGAIKSCDNGGGFGWTVATARRRMGRCLLSSIRMNPINQAEVLIALVVAAHAGVLAVRLCFSLYKA
jgi:photosystem I subunit 12